MGRILVVVLLAACASAGDPSTVTDGPPGGGDGSGVFAHSCMAGQLAVAVAANGDVTCAPITTPTRAAIDTNCSTYLGWRDSCDGCTTPPAKWGRSGATCANGIGADDTCTMQNLGGATVNLFAVNADGDVNDDDKLYGSLHCAVPQPTANIAPCPQGEYVTGLYGTSWTCSSLAVAVVDYVRSNCSLYLGWQDGCDGCTTPPGKWGFAGDKACQNGAGANNTCTIATLGTESVNLFGINTDGDVDNNDKIHVGLHCTAPPAIVSTATMGCPNGQFVSGTATDSSFQCTSPAPLFHEYFTQHCSIYFGWRDGCDGCTAPPAKWGQVKVGGCTLGVGADDTCGKFAFGQTVDMFGLNTDGDVDGNDAFYATLSCQ